MKFVFKEANTKASHKSIIQKAPTSPSSSNARALQKIADRLRPLIAAGITRGITTFRGRINLRDLLEAIESGDLAAIEAAIPLDQLDTDMAILGDLVGNGVEFSGEESTKFFKRSVARLIPTLETGPFQFNVGSAAVQSFINNRTASLVLGVNEQTRRSIRAITNLGLQRGIPARTLSTAIRNTVGLTERDSIAVMNFQLKLEEGGNFSPLQSTFRARFERGQDIDRVVGSYSDRLLRNRSLNIARTEAQAVVNAGQRQVWNQAADAGLFDPSEAQRQWVVVPDGRLDCAICKPMRGAVVPFGEPFILVDGRSVMDPNQAHPSCRCHAILIFGEADGGQPLLAAAA